MCEMLIKKPKSCTSVFFGIFWFQLILKPSSFISIEPLDQPNDVWFLTFLTIDLSSDALIIKKKTLN